MNTKGGAKRSYASKIHKTIEKGDGGDGEMQDESENTPAAEPAVAKWVIHSFFFTDDWRLGLFVENMPLDTLMTMRLLCKDWRRVADTFIDGMIESGVMKVVGGNDISEDDSEALKERRAHEPIKQVVFLLNITKVGDLACWSAIRLVVVEIPEGVESIGDMAFSGCSSLTTVSFPTTLRSIGIGAFDSCSSLEHADLLHTRLQELDHYAFDECSELKSMTIPDSLQTLGEGVFYRCFQLIPPNIDSYDNDTIINHLHSLQNA
ncbi:hypothetical protein TrST_g3577 [Triparma strigata]|uniref:Uncharacterized protein n=1 Tax=Triparma strigata TaxID=1606541 RepID=A0A9W7B5X9_9STRA|nr:hypothetical protein TrST_g3577 [Triparma strigata]